MHNEIKAGDFFFPFRNYMLTRLLLELSLYLCFFHIFAFNICVCAWEMGKIVAKPMQHPSWFQLATNSITVSNRPCALAFLLPVILLDACDQAQHFMPSIRDDKGKCRMCSCKCQKNQRKKEMDSAYGGLLFIRNDGWGFIVTVRVFFFPACRLGKKWPFMTLLAFLFIFMLLFLILKVTLCILIVELCSSSWHGSSCIITIYKYEPTIQRKTKTMD